MPLLLLHRIFLLQTLLQRTSSRSHRRVDHTIREVGIRPRQTLKISVINLPKRLHQVRDAHRVGIPFRIHTKLDLFLLIELFRFPDKHPRGEMLTTLRRYLASTHVRVQWTKRCTTVFCLLKTIAAIFRARTTHIRARLFKGRRQRRNRSRRSRRVCSGLHSGRFGGLQRGHRTRRHRQLVALVIGAGTHNIIASNHFNARRRHATQPIVDKKVLGGIHWIASSRRRLQRPLRIRPRNGIRDFVVKLDAVPNQMQPIVAIPERIGQHVAATIRRRFRHRSAGIHVSVQTDGAATQLAEVVALQTTTAIIVTQGGRRQGCRPLTIRARQRHQSTIFCSNPRCASNGISSVATESPVCAIIIVETNSAQFQRACGERILKVQTVASVVRQRVRGTSAASHVRVHVIHTRHREGAGGQTGSHRTICVTTRNIATFRGHKICTSAYDTSRRSTRTACRAKTSIDIGGRTTIKNLNKLGTCVWVELGDL
mmetsp:Transcript_2262/g.4384  ORF Transcript_2262/g.4384 Transcript_2262/m.4384 type:complete len:484 (-) Transcript_2262:181-1632(-)